MSDDIDKSSRPPEKKPDWKVPRALADESPHSQAYLRDQMYKLPEVLVDDIVHSTGMTVEDAEAIVNTHLVGKRWNDNGGICTAVSPDGKRALWEEIAKKKARLNHPLPPLPDKKVRERLEALLPGLSFEIAHKTGGPAEDILAMLKESLLKAQLLKQPPKSQRSI